MTVAAFFILIVLGIAIFPMLVLYLLPGYMALDGIASRQFMYGLKVSVGGVNIFVLDLLYAAAVLLALMGIFRALVTGRLYRYAPATKIIMLLTVIYLFFFTGKLFHGYLQRVPLDALIRGFALDTQCIYLFLPLFYIKNEKVLNKLLYFVVVLTLLFPMAQPFLYGSADQVALAEGQGGTLRLGFGNANLLLMLGVLALFVWERKIWLSALPLAGIAMLAQRSAFVALTLCVMVLSIQKRKSMKFIALVGMAGAFLVAALMVIQTTSTVPVVDKAMERLSQTFEKTGTTKARIDVIPITFEEFSKRPWVGFSYKERYELQKSETTNAFAFNMLHPHSFVFSSMLRTGTVGSIVFFLLIGLIMLAAYRLSRRRDMKEQGMFLYSAILFFVVFGLMNTSFESAGFVFWLLAGITLWYANQAHYLKYHQQRPKP